MGSSKNKMFVKSRRKNVLDRIRRILTEYTVKGRRNLGLELRRRQGGISAKERNRHGRLILGRRKRRYYR